MLHIEIIYALPEQQEVLAVELPEGSTVENAITTSGVLQKFPEIDLTQQKVGIFGKIVKPDRLLRNGDRVEIYRLLIADPKEIRRQRAIAGKDMRKKPNKTAAKV